MTTLEFILLIYIISIFISFLNCYLEWIKHDKVGKTLYDMFMYHGTFISICIFTPILNLAFMLDFLLIFVLFISKYIKIRL